MDSQSLSPCSVHSSGRRQSRDKSLTWKVGLGARSVGVGVMGVALYGGYSGKTFLIRCDYRCEPDGSQERVFQRLTASAKASRWECAPGVPGRAQGPHYLSRRAVVNQQYQQPKWSSQVPGIVSHTLPRVHLFS